MAVDQRHGVGAAERGGGGAILRHLCRAGAGWGNEGLFRTCKRTLKKVKLASRTVRLVHREAEGSLLALQLLLAQGTWGLAVVARSRSAACSPRAVLRALRAEIAAAVLKRRQSYRERLSQAGVERRKRTSGKEKRVWPGRKPHKQPGPPKILTMDAEQKALLEKVLNEKKATEA
jgi:hypothetical protein